MRIFSQLILLSLFLFTCKSDLPKTNPSSKEVYKELAEELQIVINAEMETKGIPAISIAIVDDQDLVYAEGFGFQDVEKKIPADANSIYRIGSVSKMFTDLAIMQELEKGNIDIDAPIEQYLPDFKPKNPFGKRISLRQLMTHRAGLVREPPKGHYFDDTGTDLATTVASLNETSLVYEPESRTKYSNAGIAVVGYALEQLKGRPFAIQLEEAILKPLGMSSSSFLPKAEFEDKLVEAIMWTYDGRNFPAPTFELGMAPAGSMYASVNDLAKFIQCLFRDGQIKEGQQLLSKESIVEMWTPQFAREGATSGYGLGFAIGSLEGQKYVGHGGAIYGFSTEMALLPEEKLGVVVVGSKDFSNDVMDKIATYALQGVKAIKSGNALPSWEVNSEVGKELAVKMAGTYKVEDSQIDLIARGNKLYQEGRTYKMELKRKNADTLTVDDCLGHGGVSVLDRDGNLLIAKTLLEKQDPEKPKLLGATQKAYIGEYGWDYNTLYILERRGGLQVIIEWFPMYPIQALGKDTFAFPDYGLYHGENLIFERDGEGEIIGVRAAGILFEKRLKNIEDGKTFKIDPVKETDELRKMALAANPPEEEGDFLEADLVDLASLDPSIKYDIRYASDNNFMGIPFYQLHKAYMQRSAAEAVVRVHQKLKEKGYGLLVHDAYRPWYVTKMFWDATPEKFKHFVANPANGSRHNRGCAVDLTLYELATGKVVEMVGGFDEFSDRSYADYPGGTALQRYYRELLRSSMEAEGFEVYKWEWWHFDYKDWRKYSLGNDRFEEL